MEYTGLHLSGCCTTPRKERKLAVAKPKLTTASSPNEHDVMSIGEHDIDEMDCDTPKSEGRVLINPADSAGFISSGLGPFWAVVDR